MRLITIKQIELRMSFLMKFKSLSCAVAVMSALSQGANAFDVKVEGIDGDVLFNVEVMLQPVRENSITDVRQTYRAQVDRAIQRGVQALGYYQSTIQYKWEEAKNEDGATLIAKVRLGKPVRVAGATLTVQGEAKNDEVFDALQNQLPKKGVQLNHGEYESFKSSIERAAIRHGCVTLDEALSLLDKRPENTEIVMTGRRAPRELVERAGLVTSMEKVKHFFDAGVPAREGIEF